MHYLSYVGNSEIVQELGAFSSLKMNVLDSRDRTCLHYAAIKGNSDLITTLIVLFKTNGAKFMRGIPILKSNPSHEDLKEEHDCKMMLRGMDKSDSVHVDDELFDPIDTKTTFGHP